MVDSSRDEARLEVAWRDLLAGIGLLCAEVKIGPPRFPRRAMEAVARALRELPGLGRQPPAEAILAGVGRAARGRK